MESALSKSLAGSAAGGGLAVAGAAMQSVTKCNGRPLCAWHIKRRLAFVSIVYDRRQCLTQMVLAAYGIWRRTVCAVVMVFAVGGFSNTSSPARLVLSGLAVSITLTQLVSMVYITQNISSSNAVVSWMMAHLAVSWADVWIPILSSSWHSFY